MRKISLFISIIIVSILFSFWVLTVDRRDVGGTTVFSEDMEVVDNTFTCITYDSFDDVKMAGEKIFYEDDDFSGYLFFQSAHRIEGSNKFAVVYVRAQ